MDTEETIERVSGVWNGVGGFFGFMTKLILVVVLIGTFLLIGFRLFFVDHTENHQIVYKWDRRTGEVTRIHRTGYIVTSPRFVWVGTLDGRPFQVCVSNIQRVLNCKLIQFTPDVMGVDDDGKPISGLHLFLRWHGVRDYSIGGTTNQNRQMTEFEGLMMAYAYDESGRVYPFLKIKDIIRAERKQ